MNKLPEHSGCWYCMTDFNSPLGWYSSWEFDCVLHVECLEYEINNCLNEYKDDYGEVFIFMKEFGYELEENDDCKDCYYDPQCRKCETCNDHCKCNGLYSGENIN